MYVVDLKQKQICLANNSFKKVILFVVFCEIRNYWNLNIFFYPTLPLKASTNTYNNLKTFNCGHFSSIEPFLSKLTYFIAKKSLKLLTIM